MRPKNVRLSKNIFPNSFTALNLFFGFLSIIYSTNLDFFNAGIFIIIAALCDALDGIVARLTKTSSQFGVELDSLADVVSFGAAPAFLIYKSFLIDYGFSGIVISTLPLLFGAFRLARFNVQLTGFDKKYFTGLPIPLSALTVSSLVIFYHSQFDKPHFVYIIIPLVFLLAFLMVSNVKYDKFPKLSEMSASRTTYTIIVILAAVAAVIYTEGKTLFFIFLLFILYGLVKHFFSFFNSNEEEDSLEINEELN